MESGKEERKDVNIKEGEGAVISDEELISCIDVQSTSKGHLICASIIFI